MQAKNWFACAGDVVRLTRFLGRTQLGQYRAKRGKLAVLGGHCVTDVQFPTIGYDQLFANPAHTTNEKGPTHR